MSGVDGFGERIQGTTWYERGRWWGRISYVRGGTLAVFHKATEAEILDLVRGMVLCLAKGEGN